MFTNRTRTELSAQIHWRNPAVISLTWWHSHGQREGDVTTTPAELDAMLDKLAAMSLEHWPVLADVFYTEDIGRDPRSMVGPLFTVGMHLDKGVIRYSDSPRTAYYTKGDGPADDEPILYMYMTSDNEYPSNSEIPADLVRKAAHEYAETGRRPTCVDWQEDTH
jgi:hypothetical protein